MSRRLHRGRRRSPDRGTGHREVRAMTRRRALDRRTDTIEARGHRSTWRHIARPVEIEPTHDVLPGDAMRPLASRWTRSPVPGSTVRPATASLVAAARGPRDHISKRSPSSSRITRVLDGNGWGSPINCPHPMNGPNWSGASSAQLCCECTPAPIATTIATANQRHRACRVASNDAPTSATPPTAASGDRVHTATAVTSARPMIAVSPTPSTPGSSPSAGCIVAAAESS